MMKIRNAKWLESGLIDCEIEHPSLGWIPFTASPFDAGPLHVVWDDLISGQHGEIEAFVISLDDRKAQLISAVSKLRDTKETAGFPFCGKWFQSDERSVARLNSTALTASAALLSGQNPQFPAWTAADNTELAMDARGVLALQSALTLHAGALHAHARRLKTVILEAKDIGTLAAIDIETGWPS